MFSIGIPTLNRADLLIPSLKKYVKDFEGIDIHIVDNGNQDELQSFDNIKVEKRANNLGVATSWNRLCREIFKTKDWALLINDDIYLGYGTDVVNNVINNSHNGIVQSSLNFSVILICKDLYEYIGKFDEKFYPAYYEDSDYIYRLKLNGLTHDVDTTLNPIEARISQTYEKAPDLVNAAMQSSRERYIRKWGNIPLLETFKTPFNDDNTKINRLK
jgi:GT2 family glycosyltransferase